MSLSHAALSLPDRAWAVLRDHALAWWRSVYLGAVLLVLALSPSSYRRGARRAMAHQIYVQTGPILLGFTALAQRTVAWKSKWSAPAPPSNLSIASRKSPGNGAFFMPGRRLQSPTIEP
jgi:hypothetical protein